MILSGLRLINKPARAANEAVPRYPGVLTAIDGSAAVVAMDTADSEGEGA